MQAQDIVVHLGTNTKYCDILAKGRSGALFGLRTVMAGLARRESTMTKLLVSDHVWSRIEPLLPKPQQRNALGGRPSLPDRVILALERVQGGLPSDQT